MLDITRSKATATKDLNAAIVARSQQEYNFQQVNDFCSRKENAILDLNGLIDNLLDEGEP